MVLTDGGRLARNAVKTGNASVVAAAAAASAVSLVVEGS